MDGRVKPGHDAWVADLVSRARCSALRAASQNRDRAKHRRSLRPRLCSAPLRKCCALRCVRGTSELYPPPVSCSNPRHNNTATTKNGETPMKLGAAIAEIMKREGIEILCGYP